MSSGAALISNLRFTMLAVTRKVQKRWGLDPDLPRRSSGAWFVDFWSPYANLELGLVVHQDWFITHLQGPVFPEGPEAIFEQIRRTSPWYRPGSSPRIALNDSRSVAATVNQMRYSLEAHMDAGRPLEAGLESVNHMPLKRLGFACPADKLRELLHRHELN